MWSFTTEDFEFPTLRLTSEHAGGSPPKPRATSSSSSSRGGCSSYARNNSSSGGSSSSREPGSSYTRDGSSSESGGSYQTPSPSTVCTRGGVQNSFSSGDQSSYHGSLDDLEADFDEGSTERMESLVSGLLQDEGREYQDSCLVLPSNFSRVRRNSRNCPTVEAAHRSKELQTQSENSSVSGSRRDRRFHLDCVGSTKASAGIGFPSMEMVFPHQTHHKIPKEHESALRESFLGGPTGILDDDGNLRYLSGLKQNGSGHINPQMLCEFQQRMTGKFFQDIQQRYVDQEHLEAIEARRRECVTELQVVESMEIMRTCGLHLDCAADGGLVDEKENRRKQDDLVRDLRVIANSIAQNSLVKKSAAEQTHEALVGFCNWFYQRGCPTSDTELEKVKNYIREVNRVRSHAGNLDSLHSYPAAEHLWSQRTLGTGFSSPLPEIINNDTGLPASAKSCNASAGGGSLSATLELPVRSQGSYARSRRLGTNSLKKPDSYSCNLNSPPRRKASPHGNRGQSHTSRAAYNNSPAKIVTRAGPGFHPISPISVSPPIKCAGNGEAAICVPNAKKGCHLSQAVLPEQKSSKHLAEFAGEEAGRIDGNSVPLQYSPATKAMIAQGLKSISVVLKPETAAPRARCPYRASSCRNGSALVSTGSGSPISRRQLQVSDADALQLIPIQYPSVELDVCNQGQFKTELCNNWQATQYCPYGDHCRFAHGVEELRCVLRHPRYKTIPCRMIMHGKACIYGHRCHFRHSLTTEELSLISIIDVHDASL